MILKLKLKENSRKNISVIKSHFFNSEDKITAGYVIGIAVEQTANLSDNEWKVALDNLLSKKETSKSQSTSTSISLRAAIYNRLAQIKEILETLCGNGKSLHMSDVIDLVLVVAADKLSSSIKSDSVPIKSDLEPLVAMEWNINARSGSADYIVPVHLISNEIFEKNPHLFVLTEFVKSVGWSDLKSILEEKYYVYESPYSPGQNGICIGIRRDCGIEYLETRTQTSVFDTNLNSPNFYEVRVKINSNIISIIGTRIQIDYYKAKSPKREDRISEQKQRFEQYVHLINYVSQLENVIVLGDFNNSRILGDEMELNEERIRTIYSGKDSIEYNFQAIRAFAKKKSDNKLSLYTPDGNLPSVGAFWDAQARKAKAPALNIAAKHKYDHLITNYFPEKLNYHWDFLKDYDASYFTAKGEIRAGIPDHAVLLCHLSEGR